MRSGVKPICAGLCVFALMALTACSGGETGTQDPAAQAPTVDTAAAVPVAYASLTGDAAKGEKIFLQCRTCHVLDKSVNKVGPSLHALIGSTAGQVAGYNYSAANKGSGLKWTEDQLFTYLENPQKAMPGTKMAFAGLKQPQDRADVIAYLKTATR